MITPDGARRQESLQTHPASQAVQNCHDLLLGIIQKHGVFYSDNGQNPSGSTLVNISLMHGWPDIYRVPILSPKINRSNGQSMDPEPGDQVVVAFINGNFCHPVVVGFLPPPGNSLQPKAATAPLHHTHWQGTDIKLEQDGTRRVHVQKDDLLNVVANQTETIHGNRSATVDLDDTLTVHQNRAATIDDNDTLTVHGSRSATIDQNDTLAVTGNLQEDVDGWRHATVGGEDTLDVTGNQTEHIGGSRQITVDTNDTLEVTGNGTLIIHGGLTVHIYGAANIQADGNATVTAPTATVVASTKVQLTTPLVECSQDMKVNGKLDVTGNIKSISGEVGDQIRNMSEDRTIYNSHNHLETGIATLGPGQQQ